MVHSVSFMCSEGHNVEVHKSVKKSFSKVKRTVDFPIYCRCFKVFGEAPIGAPCSGSKTVRSVTSDRLLPSLSATWRTDRGFPEHIGTPRVHKSEKFNL